MRVLVVEDDNNLREGLVTILGREGYTTVEAADGEQGLRLFREHAPNFVCLDIMMPGLSGYDVCRQIRQLDPHVPVIFISAKGEEVDRVLGLELGADDFITKPFGVREVVARIRAVSRRAMSRTAGSEGAPFVMADLEVRPRELRAYRENIVLELSLRDVQILQLLYERRGQVVTRDALFNRVWGVDHVPNSRALDQHISQLRKRIELDPKEPRLISTVHGAGYRYDP